MKRFIHPPRRLQEKLMLSYTLTSVVTFLVVEVIVIAVFLWAIGVSASTFVQNTLKEAAPQGASYFIHGPADREALISWLRILNTNIANQWLLSDHRPLFLAAVDTQGQTIASVGMHPLASNAPIQAQLSAQSRASLQAVLSDTQGTTQRVDQDAESTLVAITPIVGQGGHVQAVLILKVVSPNRLQLLSASFRFIPVTVMLVTTIAAIVGMVFGCLTARGLTRRLQRLSMAADRWSRGDFSAHPADTSEDELGQVVRQFNRMAEQLQTLLQVRQKFAMVEERNRLARDLHDSVKQQIFAVSMQIGATRVLLKRDTEAAEGRLNEAEKLVHQAQQELTVLIRELRPVALEGKGLATALRELATSWTQQNDTVATVRAEGVQTLPLNLEEALFRVAQEALSNVARHSHATLVQLILTMKEQMVTLSIADNGSGFDTTSSGRLGVGLLSMQERMRELGGDVEIESTSGKGTTILARCPLPTSLPSQPVHL